MNIPIDKQGHFWWGWAMGATLAPYLSLMAVWMALIVAILKEVVDKSRGGFIDVEDILATAIGSWCGAFLYWLYIT